MNDRYDLTLEQNIFLAKKTLIGNIYCSAKLEGINITFPQTETILQGVSVGNIPISDIEKILNLRDAWKFTIEHIRDVFDLDFIKKINFFVARNESLEWGVLRYGTVGISGTDYIPPIPNEEQEKKDLELFLISNMSVTEKALFLFIRLCKKQLFWDGNKRTAMICVNKYLIQNGKGILRIPEEKLLTFNALLSNYYSTDEEEELLYFLYTNCIEGMSIPLKR